MNEIFGQAVKATVVKESIRFIGLALLILIIASSSAQAAMYPEAKAIVLSEDSDIAVTFEGSDAGYNNLFGIHDPVYKELFWGHSAIPGTKFDLGYFPKYTELVFFIKSPDGTFLSGPALRNPDNTVHAAITDVSSQTLRMGFEDMWNGGDRDYNDITALVTGNLYVIPSNPLKPDFIIMPGDITFSNNNPTEGDIIEIQASIRNFGSSVSSDIILEFYDGNPDTGGELILSSTINGIGKEENVIKTIAWDTTGEAGTHNIYVKIDPENLIDESREDNNIVNQEIVVGNILVPALQWPLKEKSYVNGFAFGDDWIVESKKGLKDSKCGPDWKSHTGVDLKATHGDDVYAAYDGIVKVVYPAGAGWYDGIVIEHTAPDNSKFTTTYIHVNSLVKKKAKVAKKDKIATIADIDGSDHLHFGVRNSGYSEYAARGALPKNNLYKGPGNHCKTDPVFPEYFIDPMKLNYEYS